MPKRQPPQPGQQFGRLSVLAQAASDKVGRRRFLCRCVCGNETTILAQSLQAGRTKSCGCLQKELLSARAQTAGTHGHTRNRNISPTYQSWKGMLQRCTNPAGRHWKYYGERGISVCKRWRTSFDNFLADMGERPPGHTLDRINNDGNYEPGNCRWATPKQQLANRRPRTKKTA